MHLCLYIYIGVPGLVSICVTLGAATLRSSCVRVCVLMCVVCVSVCLFVRSVDIYRCVSVCVCVCVCV